MLFNPALGRWDFHPHRKLSYQLANHYDSLPIVIIPPMNRFLMNESHSKANDNYRASWLKASLAWLFGYNLTLTTFRIRANLIYYKQHSIKNSIMTFIPTLKLSLFSAASVNLANFYYKRRQIGISIADTPIINISLTMFFISC